nr:hypothetical protein [Paraburkholderia sp. BL8N3]
MAADNGPDSKQLHVLFASAGTVAAYRKDGHFPDGGHPALSGEIRRGLDEVSLVEPLR